MRPVTAKFDKKKVYSKGSPSIEFFDASKMRSSDHVTDEKRNFHETYDYQT